MPLQDLLPFYANVLAPHLHSTGPFFDALIDGLDALHCCTEIWLSSPSKIPMAKLPAILVFIRTQPLLYQRNLSIALSTIVGSRDWLKFEAEALENEEFEISAIVWAVKVGVR
jgi:hypothetical protein